MHYFVTISIRPISRLDNRYLMLFLLGIIFSTNLNGQIIYGSFYDDNTNGTYMVKVDLSTCTFCGITPASPNIGVADIVMLPDGNHLHLMGGFINRLLPPPSTQVVWQAVPPQNYQTGQLAPNGLVYLGGNQGLGLFNPATNVITYIGNWPAGVGGVTDLYYINGVLYGTGYDNSGITFLLQINTANPSLSTILGSLPLQGGAEGGTWNGNAGFFYGDALGDIYFYNPSDNSSTLVCDLPIIGVFSGLSFPPPGLPEYPCLVTCTTNAGALPQAGPFNTCTNSTLTFPAATGAVLDNNDILRYILFSNLNDTAGSIVATSATPSFNFAAPLQTNVTYYIAAMAGNNQNGNVNLNDPCLDFSNALQVVWKPLPSVTFSTANTNVCSGACKTINTNFTGTPPFTLSYNSPAGSNTQVFSGNSGSFDVCPPANSVGSFVIQATALADALCACP